VTYRRSLLAGALGAAFCNTASAQGFPVRQVKVVIPYAPGGGTDIIVRAILSEVSAGLGQPVVMENRPGAATVIGTDAVAKAAPDGYTLLASDSAFLINPGLLRDRLPYDTLRDFTGVTMLASGPVLLLAHPSTPARTVQELIAYAKANPGKLSYASGGQRHLAAPCRGAPAASGGHRSAARAVSRHRASAERPAGRAGAAHVRRHQLRAQSRRGWITAAARAHLAAAQPGDAGSSHLHRSRLGRR